MAPISLDIQTRSGRTITKLEVDLDDTVSELKKKFHKSYRTLPPERQRYTLPPKAGEAKGQVLEDSKALSTYGLKNGSVLVFKDLGPQIGYATVFFWEYFGPLVVYPLFYFLPQIFYPGLSVPAERPLVQRLALGYWAFHYIKRIVETFTIHRFGHATMPIFNLFKNCGYYWGCAAFVGYFVNHPLYTPPSELQSKVALGLAVLAQLANLRCHIILANLRAPGDKGYKIPRGFLFNFITCANYTAEIWGWILFSVATQALPAAIFTLMGAGQMAQWALQKHKRLRKIFDGKDGREKYPRRWVMLPPFF
mmetsp:Transcript_25782/g.56172  ORF Transcript_25782/g.56172 Transcript_25782/m.56172 type:complete len:308 (+) Transcript_25782:189-1112(+)|eukprot:CAMPEP_0202901332 /NCGR_PEP_ID=MMETSP1392-20130828/14195_1 /ASSEMBLY_ACC=CAM_ASM_000868 /TAXON_ID=225041 /ORGANISM="Chlamydomonas chlamydogama, Strain SAG 11-48b" /LENGTH=307 /DNA_ID=CAMNT_0049587881 /DNA_START=184 /DNA_END=1107 /DNA_ORIENTATION=-